MKQPTKTVEEALDEIALSITGENYRVDWKRIRNALATYQRERAE